MPPGAVPWTPPSPERRGPLRGGHRVAGIERTVSVEMGPLALELRPTRAFVRLGPGRRLVRVVPLSPRPRPLRRPRRSRAVALGPVRVACVGSPLVTVGLAGVNAVARGLQAPPD